MKDFIFAAFPWVVIGLTIAVLAAFKVRKSRIAENTQTEDQESGQEDNYGLLGMCLGMSMGLLFGTVTGHLALGMTPGMLIGFAIGSCIKKEGET